MNPVQGDLTIHPYMDGTFGSSKESITNFTSRTVVRAAVSSNLGRVGLFNSATQDLSMAKVVWVSEQR